MGILKPPPNKKYRQPGEHFLQQTYLGSKNTPIVNQNNNSKIKNKLKPNSVMETRKYQATQSYKQHWYDIFKKNQYIRDNLKRLPPTQQVFNKKTSSPLKWGELLYTGDFRPNVDSRILPEDIYSGKYRNLLSLQELDTGLKSLPSDKKAKAERKKKIFKEQYLLKHFLQRNSDDSHMTFKDWKLKQEFRRWQWEKLGRKYGQSFLKYNVPFNPIIPPLYETDMFSVPKTSNPNEFEQVWHPKLWKPKYHTDTYMEYLNIK